MPIPPTGDEIYFNDFSSAGDADRVDNFVAYRDPHVIAHTTGASDHGSTGGVNCTAPEQTRPQTRDNPHGHIYQCLPGGNPDAGHMMAYAMNTSGYGFVGGLPDQVFQGVEEVSVDINTTNAGGRNFVEIKVLPASQTFVNAMPCGPDLPCNPEDYDNIGGVAGGNQGSTGLVLFTPDRPDGHFFDRNNTITADNGDIHHASCDVNASYCHRVRIHTNNTGIRARYRHTLRDNGNGTISFGIADEAGTMHWVTGPGAFPTGPVRVVIAFHNYTGTKSGQGPGYEGNLSPSQGGFTWHWDNLAVTAATATPSDQWFGGHSADSIVTPDGCIAFAQGSRGNDYHRNINPRIMCEGDRL